MEGSLEPEAQSSPRAAWRLLLGLVAVVLLIVAGTPWLTGLVYSFTCDGYDCGDSLRGLFVFALLTLPLLPAGLLVLRAALRPAPARQGRVVGVARIALRVIRALAVFSACVLVLAAAAGDGDGLAVLALFGAFWFAAAAWAAHRALPR
jgi:hypothetical protein